MRLIKPSSEVMAMSLHEELPYSYYNEPFRLIEAAGRLCYKSEDKIGEGTAKPFVDSIVKRGHLSVTEHSWRSYSTKVGYKKGNSLLQVDGVFSEIYHRCIVSGNMRMFSELDHTLLIPVTYETQMNLFDLRDFGLYNHLSATVKLVCDRGVSHEIVRHRMCAFSQESTRYCNYSNGKFNNSVSFIEPLWLKDGAAQDDWLSVCLHSEERYKSLLSKGWSPQQARSVLPNSLKTEIIITATWQQWIHMIKLRVLGTTGAPHPQMVEVMKHVLDKFIELEPTVFGGLINKTKDGDEQTEFKF